MKLKINYDLIDKINKSTNGLKLQKFLLCTSSPTLIYTVIHIFDAIKKGCANLEYIIFDLLFLSANILGKAYIEYLILFLCKDQIKDNATNDLEILTKQLINLEVKTTTDLLKKSKVIDTNYEISYRDDKFPVLMQKKYICVPLSNGYEETLCQEHTIGSKNYELSVQSPTKQHSFNRKLAKSSL